MACVFGWGAAARGADDPPTLAAARRLERSGDAQAAIEVARAVLQASPADRETARWLQDVLREEGRDEEARALATGTHESHLGARFAPAAERVAAFGRLARAEGANDLVQMDLAWALLEAGELEDAEPVARALTKARARDAEAWALLGRVEEAQGQPRGARDAYQKARELDPGRPDAVAGLARVLHRLERPGEARAAIQGALSSYPRNVGLRLALAQDQLRTYEGEAAETLITSLAEERPKDARVLEMLVTVKRRLRKWADTKAAALRWLEVRPEHPPAFVALGLAEEQLGNFETALARYADAIRTAPDWPEALASAAYVQIQLGDIEFAIETLKRAFAIDRDDVATNRVQGMLEYLQGRNKQAKRYLKVALRRAPRDRASLRTLAFILLDEGKAKDALDELEKLAEIDKNDSACERLVGRALLQLTKVDEAIEHLQRAVALDEKDPWAHFDLGKGLEQKDDFEGAREAYEKAIELDAELVWPHIYLAEILDEIDGDAGEALKHYRRYLELGGPDPDNAVSQRIQQLSGT